MAASGAIKGNWGGGVWDGRGCINSLETPCICADKSAAGGGGGLILFEVDVILV